MSSKMEYIQYNMHFYAYVRMYTGAVTALPRDKDKNLTAHHKVLRGGTG